MIAQLGAIIPVHGPIEPVLDLLADLRGDDVPAADRRDAEWVRADLVGEVRYAERTTEGRLRQPSWRGWRPDKDAADVRWETA